MWSWLRITQKKRVLKARARLSAVFVCLFVFCLSLSHGRVDYYSFPLSPFPLYNSASVLCLSELQVVSFTPNVNRRHCYGTHVSFCIAYKHTRAHTCTRAAPQPFACNGCK